MFTCVFTCLRFHVHVKSCEAHTTCTPVCVCAHVWRQVILWMGGVHFCLSTPVPIHLDMSAHGRWCGEEGMGGRDPVESRHPSPKHADPTPHLPIPAARPGDEPPLSPRARGLLGAQNLVPEHPTPTHPTP